MASETTAPPGTLYIQGEGSLLVSYDRVKIHVSIRCRSVGINTATLAQTQNQETTSAFMTALEDELGITKKDLKTEHFNLNPIREYKQENGKSKSYVVGYSASVTLVVDVSTEDKSLVPQIYALASRFEADQTEVNVNNARAYVSESLKKSSFVELFEDTMRDAYFKAELYAKGAKRTLGPIMVMSDKPISIQSINPPRPEPMARGAKMMMARAGGPADAEEAYSAAPMEMTFGEGQRLTKHIHLQFHLL